MRIYYRYKNDMNKEWEKITDLYFFEEEGVHGFDGKNVSGNEYEYKFVIEEGDNAKLEIIK